MPTKKVDDARLKLIVKQTLLDLIEERDDALCNLLAEALEDVALRKAIEEGEATGKVDRATVFHELERES